MHEALIALVVTVAIVASIVGLIIWSVRREIKKDEAKQKEREALRDKWLAEEKAKARSRIWFVANGDRHCSGTFDPLYKIRGEFKPLTYTSQEHSEAALEEWYKRGWFETAGGVTFPVHMVRYANAGVQPEMNEE